MRNSLIFVWLLASFLLVFACEKQSQSPSDDSGSTMKDDDSAMKDAGEKAVFRIVSTMPGSLDPSKATGVPFSRVYAGLYQGLFINDAKTAVPVPGLAESWEVSEDGKTYTFLLRENLKWSDGVDLNAADFVYSLRRILDPETASNYAWFPASVIKGGQDALDGKIPPEEIAVQALDERRFQIEFISAFPYVIDMLTHYSFGAVPQHAIEEYGDDWVKPENYVSSGAYMMSDWRQNEYIKLVPNPYFYDQSQLTLSEVQFLIVSESETAYSMYLNEEIDWLTYIPSAVFEEVEGEPYAYIAPYLGVYYTAFNIGKQPFDDIRVRKAFALSVDKQALTRDVLKAGQIPTNSMVPPMEGYSESFPYEPEKLQENIAEAKRLLAEAGYPNGEGFPTVEFIGGGNLAVFYQEQWRVNLGVEIEVESVEWKVLLERQDNGDFDISSIGWIGDYRDPSTFLGLYTSSSDLNVSKFSNPEYDKLLEESRLSAGEERFGYFKEAEAILINDYAVFPNYFYVSTNIIDPDKWEGWYPNIMDTHHLLYIKPKQ